VRRLEDELVIIHYFFSGGINSISVSQLLSSRGYHRTFLALSARLRDCRRSPLPSTIYREGDIDAVDRLLLDILRCTERVNHLVAFTAEDAKITAQVTMFLEWNVSSLLHFLTFFSIETTSLLSRYCGRLRNWSQAMQKVCHSTHGTESE
jgi:hypothetical protein